MQTKSKHMNFVHQPREYVYKQECVDCERQTSPAEVHMAKQTGHMSHQQPASNRHNSLTESSTEYI